MDDFNIWGAPSKKKKKKQDNIFSGNFDLGLSPKRGRTKNPLDIGIGFGSSQKEETGRDARRAFTQSQKNKIYKYMIDRKVNVPVRIAGINHY